MKRRGLHTFISDEAHAGYEQTAARHRISATALVEVLGLRLLNDPHALTDDEVDAAAKIDADRRRRAPTEARRDARA